MYCRSCGEQLPAGAMFCAKCGVAATLPTPPQYQGTFAGGDVTTGPSTVATLPTPPQYRGAGQATSESRLGIKTRVKGLSIILIVFALLALLLNLPIYLLNNNIYELVPLPSYSIYGSELYEQAMIDHANIVGFLHLVLGITTVIWRPLVLLLVGVSALGFIKKCIALKAEHKWLKPAANAEIIIAITVLFQSVASQIISTLQIVNTSRPDIDYQSIVVFLNVLSSAANIMNILCLLLMAVGAVMYFASHLSARRLTGKGSSLNVITAVVLGIFIVVVIINILFYAQIFAWLYTSSGFDSMQLLVFSFATQLPITITMTAFYLLRGGFWLGAHKRVLKS